MKQRANIADLIEDSSLYPRHTVDSGHVANLVRAYRAGVKLPPPRVDADSMRISDGWHRVRAMRKVYGENAMVTVDLVKYESEADLVKDAIELNASHGRRFDSQDVTRCVLMMKRYNIPTTEIAVMLRTTEEHVIKMSVQVVIVDGEPQPAKPNLRPAPGEPPKQLTAEQYSVAKGSSGWHPLQTIRQLVRELQAGLIDTDDPRVFAALSDLLSAVTQVIAAQEGTG
jgi:hypothetical protein